jgi:uncharacterized protein YaaN involved in tellurite resistance
MEELRQDYDRLRTERIRAESEVERLEREFEDARQEALAEFGTDSDAEIARLIAKAQAENAASIASFAALLADVEEGLRQLEGETP